MQKLVLGEMSDRVKVTLFIGRDMKKLSDFINRCRSKLYDFGSKREGWGGGIGEWIDESLRRRLKTLSDKNIAKDSASDDSGIIDGSEVVCLRCSNEFMFFFPEEMWIGD